MLFIKHNDILLDNSEALVNPINCVGIMGKGLAFQFKKKYPENFKSYYAACRKGIVKPGHMFVFATNTDANPHYIINFPTKRHWKDNSKIEDIESGLKALCKIIQINSIHSIAIPALGCGLGSLNWKDVKPLIKRILIIRENVSIIIFEP